MYSPTALIVEDDPDLAFLLAYTLQTAGFKTSNARDGKQAVDNLNVSAPDILVLDMHLPYMTGIEIWDTFRDDPRFASTYVIVVSGDPCMVEQLCDKVDLVLNKPLDPIKLQGMAAQLCQ
jgi:two-component system sensor histidine kinase/response regulator